MTLDLHRFLEAKRALRHHLTDLPVAEKLRMLDALRQRAAAIHQADTSAVRRSPGRGGFRLVRV